MKRKLLILLFLLLVIFSVSASASYVWEPKTVTLPTFPVVVNEQEYNYNEYEEYPVFVYKDVTYFPLTYNNAMILNLVPTWDEEICAHHYVSGNPNEPKQFFKKSHKIVTELKLDDNTVQVDSVTYQVHHLKETPNNNTFDYQYEVKYSNGTINGQSMVSLSDYPILFYNDMTYIPLTWQFVTEVLGGTVTFDNEKGLEVRVDNFFTTLNGDSYITDIEGGGTEYSTVPNDTYYIKDSLTVYLFTDTQRLLGPVYTNLTIKNGDNVIKPEGYFGYYQKNGPLFTVEYDKIKTNYYTGLGNLVRNPVPCIIDISTGKITDIE